MTDLANAVKRVKVGVLSHALAQIAHSDVAIALAKEQLQSSDYFVRLEAEKELKRATSYRATHAADAAALNAVLAALNDAREALEIACSRGCDHCARSIRRARAVHDRLRGGEDGN